MGDPAALLRTAVKNGEKASRVLRIRERTTCTLSDFLSASAVFPPGRVYLVCTVPVF